MKKPAKGTLAFGALAALGSVAALGLTGGAAPRRAFLGEVRREFANQPIADSGLITDASIAVLPEPVRRYFHACGYVGNRQMRNARITWDKFDLKRGRDKGWMRVKAVQYNFVPEPARLAFMDGRIAGVIPFAGRDKYQEGHGHMRIRAVGFLKIADTQSRRMDQSALVTLLAEALLVPSYALQPYIRWEPIDSLSARAVIGHNGVQVSGVFHFNAAGENIRFTTRDRWQDGNDVSTIPWSAIPAEYIEKDGLRIPSNLSAVWHEKSGDFEYFRGRIGRIEFDAGPP